MKSHHQGRFWIMRTTLSKVRKNQLHKIFGQLFSTFRCWDFICDRQNRALDRKQFDHQIQWNESCCRAISSGELQLFAKVRSFDVFLYLIDLHKSVFNWRIRQTHEVLYFPHFHLPPFSRRTLPFGTLQLRRQHKESKYMLLTRIGEIVDSR